MKKEIICIANSWKPGGHCVAGIEMDSYDWIRPISTNQYHSISDHHECIRKDCVRMHPICFIKPQKLDVLEIEFDEYMPILHQQENYLINEDIKWKRIDKYNLCDLPDLIDEPKKLWYLGSSASHGFNDRVPESVMEKNSLYLIRPDDFAFVVQMEGQHGDRKAVRGLFSYNGISYKMKVTDAEYREYYLNQSLGVYHYNGDLILCISLAEESWFGYYYKIIAAIYEV